MRHVGALRDYRRQDGFGGRGGKVLCRQKRTDAHIPPPAHPFSKRDMDVRLSTSPGTIVARTAHARGADMSPKRRHFGTSPRKAAARRSISVPRTVPDPRHHAPDRPAVAASAQTRPPVHRSDRRSDHRSDHRTIRPPDIEDIEDCQHTGIFRDPGVPRWHILAHSGTVPAHVLSLLPFGNADVTIR